MSPIPLQKRSGSGTPPFWRRWWSHRPLGWGCEISSGGVAVARWNGRGAEPDAAAWRPLAEGAVEPSPLRENLTRPDEVRQAIAGCLESLGRERDGKHSSPLLDAALLIPDPAARVFFLTLEAFPPRPADAIPLLRWKLKKSVPFDMEASTISYAARQEAEGWRILAVVSPQAILRQYEAVVESAGLKPRLVTLSTLGALRLVPAGAGDSSSPPSASCLVAKFSPPWLTTAILHAGTVCLFRCVALESAGAEELANPSRQIVEAIHPAAAYFQDTFGRSLEQAYLCGMESWAGAVADSLG
ncbi:MAG TPA: hypothetical protein VNN17_11605, partial [Terriglobia bacterium]|nr:hypothetical protein [Terriglobia bacterium]